MQAQGTISRRELLGVATALSTASLVGPVGSASAAPARRVADGSSGQLPPRGEFVVRNAVVLTMDPAIPHLPRGDVHVRNGTIVAVGVDLPAPGAESLDGRGMIALPGLIDTHFHLWNSPLRNLVDEGPERGYFPLTLRLGQVYTPEDIYRGVRLGVAELLYSGITTVHDWSHNIRGPAYADADVRALLDTGIRAHFSYGTPQGGLDPDASMDLADLARFQRQWGTSGDGLLTLGMASRSITESARGAVTTRALHRDWDGARALGLPITMHASANGVGALLAREGLLGSDVQLINGSHFGEADRDAVAVAGAHVSLSPFSNMRSSLGLSQLLELQAMGILTSLSIDTPAITGNTDMFAHMRLITDLSYARSGDVLSVTPYDVLALATINGARDLGIADRTGSLTPGKRADLILVRTTDLNMAPLGDPVVAIVHSAQPHNVDAVVVDGRIVKRSGQLTSLDAEQIIREAAETLAGLRQRAGLS
jgi:5-methylthioadenosine/S-adenosylhomocysteine deaminase